ncbi:MAG TPA: thiamine pyrophosphate-binding protein, partial [Hyphomicrobiaceae bacterium]|nr:thiamine pyrophosphate-binding protein [Hyphomicrobiaceae bacterium]
MTAGKIIVDALVAHGIDRVFCVPGESYLGLLDALYQHDKVDTVVCRHEAGAGFMALADARLTGRPGVACVSRGPGASNAAIAVHTAQQDGVPFLLFVGQVSSQDVRRDSFQEIDYGQMFGKIAKWTAEVTDPERMAETMLRALQVAVTGVPGPVVIAVPEDVLGAACREVELKPQAPVTSAPTPEALAQARYILETAACPVVLAGSGVALPGDRAALLAFLEHWDMPAMVSFRRQDLLPNRHRLYAGDMGLSIPPSQMAALREADVLLVVGARLSDITTQGYLYPDLIRPAQKLIHVHADASVLGTHFACDVAIASPVRDFLAGVGRPSGKLPDRHAWIGKLRGEREKIATVRSFDVDDGIPFELVVDRVSKCLPDDAIVTLDAGTFGAPVYRVMPFTPP